MKNHPIYNKDDIITHSLVKCLNNKDNLKEVLELFQLRLFRTIRSRDNYSIVIVNPFVSTGTENQRYSQVAKGISGALFIGKHGENINRFLLDMNNKLVSLGMQ